VLSGKRDLSLNMIRRLHEGLNIPAEILLKKPDAKIPEDTDIEWTQFPLNELRRRGWFESFSGSYQALKDCAEEWIAPKLNILTANCTSPLLPRMSNARIRSKTKSPDIYALIAWQCRVIEKAISNKIASYKKKASSDLLKQIRDLSVHQSGPLLAQQVLADNGIHLIIEQHFKKTYLDGGVMLLNNGAPVIGLTLRMNRLDNFWFSLMHELAHIVLHLNDNNFTFFDDLEQLQDLDGFEMEADSLASDILIPKNKWSRSKSLKYSKSGSFDEIESLATSLHINPAILVGRIHFESDTYERYGKLLGKKIPKTIFTEQLH
ncbi:MAG: ImmA/IrrE family metallo-endopeptidase, partial [bacterium]